MSNLYQRKLALAGIDFSGMGKQDLQRLVRELLETGIHGISFSPYIEGQGPGTQISEQQIRDRLSVISSHVRSVRSFSCTDGHELIPAIAKAEGLKTMVGAWLDDDREHNALEIENAIAVGQAGHADILAVGNEVLLRGEMTEDELIDYIETVKQACPGVPVGYVDAYFEFVDHPRVSDACDVILANCYPFWEGCPVEHALLYMKEMYRKAQYAAKGKPVIISETGWPNIGTPTDGAEPSYENAIRYFLNTFKWAEEDNIDVFYFSAFDEAWKVADEGDVGAYWGIWDSDGKPKYT
ncbi:MAG: glycosyl hydrolase family 17 protein [Woeseiaceae bacterium]